MFEHPSRLPVQHAATGDAAQDGGSASMLAEHQTPGNWLRSRRSGSTPLIGQSVLHQAIGLVLGLAAAYYLLAFVGIALSRLDYPFELNWMESHSVDSSRRIVEGRELYTAPTIDFISPIYSPLYYWLSAGLMKLIGFGFLAPRLVSFLAAVGSIALIFAVVNLETHRPLAGLLGAGLFAATYRATGAFLDIARVDSLFIFWMLLAIYLARRYPGVRGAALGALALVLAYYTKQAALLALMCLGGYYLLTDRRAGVVFALVALVTAAPFYLYSNMTTGGWFSFYTAELLGQHDVRLDRHNLVLADVRRFAWMTVASGLFALWLGRTTGKREPRNRWLFYMSLLAAMLAMSYLGRLNSGGGDNVLLPAAAILAVVTPLALASALRRRTTVAIALAALMCGVQFATLLYDPARQVPTAADRAAGEQLLQTIRSFSGDVYIPAHTTYAAQAGKPTYAHWTAVGGVEGVMYTNRAAVRGSSTESRRALVRPAVRRAIESRQFEAIILDELPHGGRFAYWTEHLTGHYELRGVVFPPEHSSAFWPVTGYRLRPQFIYVRKG